MVRVENRGCMRHNSPRASEVTLRRRRTGIQPSVFCTGCRVSRLFLAFGSHMLAVLPSCTLRAIHRSCTTFRLRTASRSLLGYIIQALSCICLCFVSPVHRGSFVGYIVPYTIRVRAACVFLSSETMPALPSTCAVPSPRRLR
ncbi:hypothetical protein PENSPDRAFT_363374 [Peniophora sp. CONT]|nr:hypothetical protein PENSPDRAFT_363374 [Peniophora sp. CONT]